MTPKAGVTLPFNMGKRKSYRRNYTTNMKYNMSQKAFSEFVGYIEALLSYDLIKKSTKYPDPRRSSYSKWISSNASVSSQGSVSETGVNRPVRPLFVPTAVVEPVKKNPPGSTALVPTLRRRNDSFRKSMLPQKTLQSNTTTQAVTTFNRPPSGIAQPQQIFVNAAYSTVGATPDIRSRHSSFCEVLPLSGRPVDYRRYSAASSLAFEPKEFPIKLDSPTKPPASAPPSILVKPDTPKGCSDKVKTVRFMNFSPPTLKRQSAHFDDKLDELSNQPSSPENCSTSDALMTAPLRLNHSSAQPAEGRKIQKLKNACNDLTPQSTLSFPNKKAINYVTWAHRDDITVLCRSHDRMKSHGRTGSTEPSSEGHCRKALLETGASGSIAKAWAGSGGRQKDLEESLLSSTLGTIRT
ncbi:unnamed protein product [Ranitomeya imitator]|uniref:Uncharacterized protein n=1 Tax=Ranitomeya imitator TaxID=111125 RepID=A0ABN9LXD5_9NEOB|nr:unnamed protein product [Ranitomeya imitator]